MQSRRKNSMSKIAGGGHRKKIYNLKKLTSVLQTFKVGVRQATTESMSLHINRRRHDEQNVVDVTGNKYLVITNQAIIKSSSLTTSTQLSDAFPSCDLHQRPTRHQLQTLRDPHEIACINDQNEHVLPPQHWAWYQPMHFPRVAR